MQKLYGCFDRNEAETQIRNKISLHHFREHVGTIANQTDRDCALCLSRLIDQLQCLIERFRHVVAISGSEALLDPWRMTARSGFGGTLLGGLLFGTTHGLNSDVIVTLSPSR